MNPRLFRIGAGRLAALAAACAVAPAVAQSGPFEPVSQNRGVFLHLKLDTLSGNRIVELVDEQIPLQPEHHEPGELTLRVDTPGVVTVNGPQATGSVEGHVLQHSVVGPSSLDFEVVAQGRAFGSSTPPGNYSAEIQLASFYSVSFDVAKGTRVSITMDRHVTLPVDFFNFTLIRHDFTAGICCTSEQLSSTSFTQLAFLGPGRYDLSAVGGSQILSNTSGNPFPVSTLVLGSMHIVALPIPEPHAWILMFAGLLAVGAGLRARRSP